MDRWLRATVNTWHGLIAAARSEAAFREELAALALAVPLAFLVAVETWKRCLLIGVVVLLLIVELLNTAIEKLAEPWQPYRSIASLVLWDLVRRSRLPS